MGTRNLTMVIEGEKPVVAQYGQWDGYPSGQGMTALEFLRSKSLKKFKKKLKLVRFATEEDEGEVKSFMESIGVTDGWMDMNQAGKYHQKYPLLTRDNGAQILQMIQDNNEPIFLTDSSGFAKDSLFCEWAYVIDLDNNTFEVFEGFNQSALDEGERFHGDKSEDSEYFPVRGVKIYPLDNLPTKTQFLKDLETVEEEEVI